MIGPQWFQLSLLNFIFILFVNKSKFLEFIIKISKTLFVKFYLLFLILSISTFFFASSKSFYFHDLGRLLCSFIFLLNATFCFICIGLRNALNVLLVSFLFLFLYEIYLSTLPFFNFFKIDGFSRWNLIDYSSTLFKGIAGNKNITAALFMLKLPFLLFLIHNKNYFIKLISSILFLLIFIVLLFLQARATYISFSFFLFFYILFLFLYKKKKMLLNLIFILIPFFIAFTFVNFINQNVSSNNESLVSSISSIELNNESSSNRFSLWSDAVDHIIEYPFGVGLGNWKLESIPYWKQMGGDYQVPYHAHNDFLEIAAESGIYTSLIYLFLFGIVIYYCFIYFSKNLSIFYFVIFSGLFIYLIDALLNFPLERTYMQLLLHIYFALYLTQQYLKSEL